MHGCFRQSQDLINIDESPITQFYNGIIEGIQWITQTYVWCWYLALVTCCFSVFPSYMVLAIQCNHASPMHEHTSISFFSDYMNPIQQKSDVCNNLYPYHINVYSCSDLGYFF